MPNTTNKPIRIALTAGVAACDWMCVLAAGVANVAIFTRARLRNVQRKATR